MATYFKEFFYGDTSRYEGHYLRPLRFVVLFLTIAITIFLIVLMKNKTKKQKRIVVDILAASVFLTELINKTMRYVKGETDLFRLLAPLQFSSFVIYMLMLVIVIRKQWYMNITVLGTLFSGIMYLLLPGAGMHDTPIRMSSFNSIYTHSIDFIFGVYAIGVGLTSFKKNKIWTAYLFFGFISVYAILVNIFIPPHYGYFYLRDPEFIEIFKFINYYEIILAIVIVIYVQSIYYFSNKKNKQVVKN